MTDLCIFTSGKLDYTEIVMPLDKKNLTLVPALLFNLLNSLQKSGTMLGKHRIISIFPNSLNKFNNVGTHVKYFIQGLLVSDYSKYESKDQE